MNEELKRKVIDDLEKSGFGSEMRAVQVLLSKEWSVQANNTFFDKDEQKSRESDIHAYRALIHKFSKDKWISNFFHIVAEVKKSDKPWVVLRSKPLREFELADAWQNLIFYDYLPVDPRKFVKAMTKDSLLNQLKWVGSGIHESFKPPDNASRWYSAFITACKAAEGVLQGESWPVEEKELSKRIVADLSNYTTHFVFVKPVVILDGILLSATLADNGTIEIEEIKSAVFDFRFKSSNYTKERYSVDVVALNGLDEYICLCQQRQKTIHKTMLDFAGVKE